ncbi:hypothetical protein [Caulobacter sp. 17J65-9]|uniref:hypothetical protein n=1 Tax=Caulobacter sp. 17J65-9 TaxID=2709382 RepID=UPI0013CA4197|nr:hypothetical protein [Caulobacter sp. 17J65-9]NEX94957.1 hypothetical protein [Caulobacter sp. 17J65-9]
MRTLVLSLALSAVALPAAAAAPAETFFAQLSALCGRSFEGEVVSTDPADADFRGKRLVMTVRDCSADEVRVPFAVGEDRSRTWIVTRTAAGLRLKHDHRHADGTPDALTLYGGDTSAPGTAGRQEFPVDAESKALFEREGRAASLTNVWAMEIEPGRAFVYELSRPNRLFRVRFDLTRPVAP